MKLETERLILRPWLSTDAENLYEYAKDQRVGPIAGWPVHTSVENSREIIENVLAEPETYAVCLKENNKAIGSIGLMIGEKSNLEISDNEAEIGYWIGVPFWGKGLIPEAVRELMRYAFEDLHMKKVWCGYFDGNEKSKRVQEKCGFQYQFTNKDIEWPLMNDIRTEHVTCITKAQWYSVIGKIVTVLIDRPLGSSHPVYKDTCYPINYGYVEGVMAPDGEEQDAYILGLDKAADEFTGKIIAVIHRNNDIEEKWVVCPVNMFFTEEEIREQTHFQEQYFDIEIWMK